MGIERRIAGLKAKRSGQRFENFFEVRCRQLDISCIRIPDGCRVIGQGKIVRTKTPFDYIIGFEDKIVFLDLKSTSATNFTYSQIDQDQIRNLNILSKHQKAGYLVYHSSIETLVYYDINDLMTAVHGERVHHKIEFGNIFSADLKCLF